MKKYILIFLLMASCNTIETRQDNGILVQAKQCREGKGKYYNCNKIYIQEKDILVKKALKEKHGPSLEQKAEMSEKNKVAESIKFKSEFFKLCEAGYHFKPLKQEDLYYYIANSNYILSKTESGFTKGTFQTIADYKIIVKNYDENIKLLQHQFNEINNLDDDQIFHSTEYFTVPQTCNTKEKYTLFLENKLKDINKDYNTIISFGDKEIKRKYEYILQQYVPAYNISLRGFEKRHLTLNINSITRNEGIKIAKTKIFTGSKYKGWEMFYLLILLNDGTVEFASNENLLSTINFERENYKTYIEKIDIDKIIVKSEYHNEWTKFILQPTNTQKFQRGQNLDEYAFKVIGTTKYQNENWIVVEAFK